MVLKINKKTITDNLETSKKMPETPLFTEGIARCYHWLGKENEAKEWFIKTAEMYLERFNKPNNIKTSLYEKGSNSITAANMLIKGGKAEEAEAILQKAIEYLKEYLKEKPYWENAWGKIAQSHFLLKQYNEVLVDLEELHKIHSKPYPGYDAYGLMVKAKQEKNLGYAKEALEIIEKIIRGQRLKPYYEGDTVSMWDMYEAAMEIIKELEG